MKSSDSRSVLAVLRNLGAASLLSALLFGTPALGDAKGGRERLEGAFHKPPDSARPWVYWFWMDGNVSREGITADLESMHRAGLGGVILMEVDVGIPRGPVKFMSPEWRGMFGHAVREAGRLGLQITLNAGPGWTGSGGPWVKPEQSMQHLVSSSTEVTGPQRFEGVLPQPKRRPAFFGDGALPPEQEKAKNEFYRDVSVLAFPTPTPVIGGAIGDLDQKALYVRAPYSSQPGTPPFLSSKAVYPALPDGAVVDLSAIVEITGHLSAGGRLGWDVPPGKWTILRLGRTSTGANTRPAPAPGLGLESDKFDRAALDSHFDAFVGSLMREVGRPQTASGAGWTSLHIDSWEMGSQNWTLRFREEFRRRRGYDLLPYLPTLAGVPVGVRADRLPVGASGQPVSQGRTAEVSERFLWDLRQTSQELVVENHATRLKELGRRYGLGLSIEPYDMNPCADLTLGGVADVPMCEFWLVGFNTTHTVPEAVSVAHTNGRRVVAAEAFTSSDAERWQAHPAMMKSLGDWAFCAGVNRIVFHRYQHQPQLDRWPGMTMGPYGVHWERTQTWWEMVPAYHGYLARCQQMLREGLPVADVCFLAAEGAPQVFRPPTSAIRGDPADNRGYAFDGCAPEALLERASVKNGRVVFPDGMSYRVLVLPERETMTPRLLKRIRGLIRAGATVIGPPPLKSPSLSGFPACDEELRDLAHEIWGDCDGVRVTARGLGRGRIVWEKSGAADLVRPGGEPEQYGRFGTVQRVLEGLSVPPDFAGDDRLRFHHRTARDLDVYFVANGSTNRFVASCGFRVVGREAELWDPMTGGVRPVAALEERDGRTWIPISFDGTGSVFVVFSGTRQGGASAVVSVRREGIELLPSAGRVREGGASLGLQRSGKGSVEVFVDEPGTYRVRNEAGVERTVEWAGPGGAREVQGPWDVTFQPGRGAPERSTFSALADWSTRPEPGVKFFSGIATYRTRFESAVRGPGERTWLDLGRVEVMARVRLNGRELGVLWKEPFRVDVTDVLHDGANELEVAVANRWPNRLIGDRIVPEPERVTSTTWNPFRADSALLPSGLLGPVTLKTTGEVGIGKW